MRQRSEDFLDALLNLPEIKHVRLSPDGKQITLNISNLHANWDVFLTPAEVPEPVTALTNTTERTRLLKWWPDSKSVIIAEDKGGN